MKLKIKLTNWSAGMPVAILNKRVADKIGVHAGDRVNIFVGTNEKKFISTIVDTVESHLGMNQIGVSQEIKEILHTKDNQNVSVEFTSSPDTVNYIRKKLAGKKLTESEIKEIIEDIVLNRLSEPEIAVFVSAMYKHGMVFEETISLIKAILASGKKLNLKNKLVADKHCIGGIAGNRTTPIVISICAATGLIMPKTSSRAITSAAGTADCVESLAPVEFKMEELKKIIQKTGACLAWGGAVGMVPADSKIIKIEKMLKLDPQAQLLASIMSKKIAASSKYILIDIPYGENAKVSKEEAKDLKKKFEKLSRYFKLKLKVVLTRTNEPIGNGIGPNLEMIDVMKVLNPNEKGPKDLEKKSIFLSGILLEMTGKAKKGKGKSLAEEILKSGEAWKKFLQIIHAQGGEIKELFPAKYSKTILAKKSGKIKKINNSKINYLGRLVGCPQDKGAGLYIEKHVGEIVKKEEKILTLYAQSRSRLKEAIEYYEKSPAVII